MQYEIRGGAFPIVICQLEAGEKMITEKGSMTWMTPNMHMDTQGGGLGKMFSKAFSGESMFQNIYTAQGGPGMITFGSSFPGKIVPIEVGPGKEWILQKSAFLASEAGVKLDIFFNRKFGAGLFGGFLQFSGEHQHFGEGAVEDGVPGLRVDGLVHPAAHLGVFRTRNVQYGLAGGV